MQLKYIWIKEYGPLKSFGINFDHGGKEFFDYDGKNLNIKIRVPNILNFGAKITGVTAIAGQNGSGKSSLNYIVLHSTATYTNGIFGYNMIFEGIVCYDNHIFYHQNIALSNQAELSANGFELMAYKDSPLEELDFEDKKNFAQAGFIYYSNLFDFSTNFHGVNLLNISSANLLWDDSRYTTAYTRRRQASAYGEYLPKDHLEEVEIHLLAEGYRQIKFYLEEFDRVPFQGPALIGIQSAYSSNNRWLKFPEHWGHEVEYPYKATEHEIFKAFYPYKSVSPEKFEEKLSISSQSIKTAITQLYRLNLLRIEAINTEEPVSANIIHSYVFQTEQVDESAFSRELLQLSALHAKICEIANFGEDFELTPYQLFSSNAERREDWRFSLLVSMYVPNTDEGRKMLQELMRIELEFLNEQGTGLKRISNYFFPNFFSSGESAFLTLFGRLQHAISLSQAMDLPKKDIVIFIDEGDAGFHPKWSKMFLKWILDYLNNTDNSLRFQLIFSTHSPYLLSDLASQNTILLHRVTNGHTEILRNKEEGTFGANIHELLSDSFFMDDGTVGEFAKTEINRVIDQLNEWLITKSGNPTRQLTHVTREERDNTWEIIRIIGDRIVRDKLAEMYMDVFQDQESIKEEIAYLENRIKNLKRNDRNTRR